MSTRGCYVFKDENRSFTVYKHYDNYEEGAAGFLTNALTKAWPLPRFEADEFAAAFVSANKPNVGDVRLTHKAEDHADIEYVYEVFQAKNGQLCIHAYNVNFWGEEPKYEEFFYGRLKEFVAKYGDSDVKIKWDKLVPSKNPLEENKLDIVEYENYLRLKLKYEDM